MNEERCSLAVSAGDVKKDSYKKSERREKKRGGWSLEVVPKIRYFFLPAVACVVLTSF